MKKIETKCLFWFGSPKRISPEIEIQKQVVQEMKMGKGVNETWGRHLVIREAAAVPTPT